MKTRDREYAVFDDDGYVRAFNRFRTIQPDALKYWIAEVERLVPANEDHSRILDACCGTARLSFPLARALENHASIVGVDRSSTMVESCHQYSRTAKMQNFTVCQCDILEYDPGFEFDVILISEALHAFSLLAPLFQKCRALLKASGSLLIRSPSHEQLKRIEWLSGFEGLVEIDCQRTPDTVEVEAALASEGYEAIRSEAVDESVVFEAIEQYLEPLRNRAFSILYSLTTVELQAGLSRLREALPNENIRHTFWTTRTIARKGKLQ